MRLTTNEKQSLSHQLLGTGGWRPCSAKRAEEIEAIFNADEDERRADILRRDNTLYHVNNKS